MSKFKPEANGRLANGELNPCFLATKQKFDYVGFFYQTIDDLWGYYIMDVNDDILSRDHKIYTKVEPEMVGRFREWLYDQGYYAVEDYLPQSDSTVADIIKQCINAIDD